MGVLYLLAVVFLACTVYLVVRVITGDGPLPYPSPAEFLDDLPGPASCLKRQRVASLLVFSPRTVAPSCSEPGPSGAPNAGSPGHLSFS